MRRLLILASLLWVFTALLALPWAESSGAPEGSPPREQVSQANPHGDEPLFAHSSSCVACHNEIVTPQGEDVSIGAAWRSTMMANSARDPYWHAAVRRETIDHPTHVDEIQSECARCHMPMTQKPADLAGHKGGVFAYLPGGAASEEDRRLAGDGIACTVCHQMAKDKLGTPESYNAHFVVAPPVDGVRQALGPHDIDAGRERIMRSVTGYDPVKAPHIRQSEMCASCHTLITQSFGPSGEVVGRLPEQMNYPEWLHSAFNREQRSCQSCHMPRAAGPVRISSVLGEYRDGLSRHGFVGGNAFMLRIFSRYRDELGVEALPAALEATALATSRQLREDTASVAVAGAGLSGATLAFDVDVRNLTGHKFPTGYPSRRTWLHVTVRDRAGRPVFESGAPTPEGAITGNDNDEDAARFEPHHEEITTPGQVQIYEPILGDPQRRPTSGLLTATQYLKDNRLLPRGFDKATAPPDVGVHGGATGDPDFAESGDRVRYRVAVPAGGGPFTVKVALRYQTIGYRWAHNLAPYDAPEPRRFLGYYKAMSKLSAELVAEASVQAR